MFKLNYNPFIVKQIITWYSLIDQNNGLMIASYIGQAVIYFFTSINDKSYVTRQNLSLF